MSICINDIEFEAHPDIGIHVGDPKAVNYRFDYFQMMDWVRHKRFTNLMFNKELGKDELTEEEEDKMRVAGQLEKEKPGTLQNRILRYLIENDLWFLLYFVVKPFADASGRGLTNSPFVVKACQEVERGPGDFTLDVWAREHFKSSIITIAETIQYQLKNPECSTGIFSYIAPKAKDFLFSIKSIFEREQILYVTHPDVVWEDKRQSSLWSLDEGIVLRRKSNRQEPSIGAYGLVEGMPTGMHFERRIYDDIITEDMADSFDVLEKVKIKFDSSQNLGKENGHHRVIGTYYHHEDPLIYIRDKMKTLGDGSQIPAYTLRFKPATIDGTAVGKPAFLSQKRLDELKLTKTFNCQQLLDPTPSADQRLNPDYLQPIERQFIPRTVYRFMIIDQAGDDPTNRSRDGDAWCIAIYSVEPVSDEIGQSKVFIENLWVEVAGESEAIEQAVKMYISAGIVKRLGVEKVGLSTTHIHIARALKARGRYVEFSDNRTTDGILLRPAGRNKRKFIEAAVAWPLNNSKIFYSCQRSIVDNRFVASFPTMYLERLKMEMKNFPLWHDDVLNTLAYLYDVIKDYHFSRPPTGWEMVEDRLANMGYILPVKQKQEDKCFPVPVVA